MASLQNPFDTSLARLVAPLFVALCALPQGVAAAPAAPAPAPGAPAPPAPAPAAAALVLSTMPFDNSSDQSAIFSVLREQLEKKLGQPVRFEAGTSYHGVIDGIQRGTIDVALVGALSYVQARMTVPVRVLLRTVRRGTKSYRGVVVVPKESPAQGLGDLRGKRFAFVDKTSTSGYLYPRMLLKEAGLDAEADITPLFAGSHREVVEWVAGGKADAGACFQGAPEMLERPEALRVVARTGDIVGDPVVVKPGLAPELAKRLRSALIDLASTPAAAPFFSAAEIDTFVPATDHDYDALAALAAAATPQR
jgi:phosphonate transport system substrate-binding protein